MKWTYEEYLDQPEWFIDLLIMKSRVDAEMAEIEAKKLKSQNG